MSGMSSKSLGRGAMAAAALVVLGTIAAGAQDAPGRFTMSPTDGGFVRLDTETGAMAMCTGKEGAWSCKAMPDDQKAMQDRIARLEEENRALREETARLGASPAPQAEAPKDGPLAGPPGDAGPPTAPGAGPGFKIPSEKDVDKAFDYVEGLLKKFRERLKKLEEKEKGGVVPL